MMKTIKRIIKIKQEVEGKNASNQKKMTDTGRYFKEMTEYLIKESPYGKIRN